MRFVYTCVLVISLNYSSLYSSFCAKLHVGGVLTDQAEADEDTSLKERAALGVGKS